MSHSSRGIERLLIDQRINAVAAWSLVGFVVFAAVESLLTGDLLWAGFAVTLGALVLWPPLSRRTPWAMLPWEVVLLAALPVVGRSVATVPVTGEIATYLSVAAIALVVAVDLDAFTPVRMNYSFAVVFVVVATLATAGIWAVVRWLSDLWLGTQLLLDPALTEDEIETALMWEFVASAVAGVAAGVIFEFYVRRRARLGSRLEEVAP